MLGRTRSADRAVSQPHGVTAAIASLWGTTRHSSPTHSLAEPPEVVGGGTWSTAPPPSKPVCFPGQVAVPDNGNTLHNSQPGNREMDGSAATAMGNRIHVAIGLCCYLWTRGTK